MQKPLLKNLGASQSTDSADGVSLSPGGLFYGRAQVQAHLIDTQQWNVWRRVIIVLAVTWLPLVILTALFDRDRLVYLLTDHEVYSRVAIAITVLLTSQLVMEGRFSMVAKHLREARLLHGEDLQKMKGVLATIKRLRDSPLSELIIVALILIDIALIWNSRVASGPGWAVYRSGGVAHLRAAAGTTGRCPLLFTRC